MLKIVSTSRCRWSMHKVRNNDRFRVGSVYIGVRGAVRRCQRAEWQTIVGGVLGCLLRECTAYCRECIISHIVPSLRTTHSMRRTAKVLSSLRYRYGHRLQLHRKIARRTIESACVTKVKRQCAKERRARKKVRVFTRRTVTSCAEEGR